MSVHGAGRWLLGSTLGLDVSDLKFQARPAGFKVPGLMFHVEHRAEFGRPIPTRRCSYQLDGQVRYSFGCSQPPSSTHSTSTHSKDPGIKGLRGMVSPKIEPLIDSAIGPESRPDFSLSSGLASVSLIVCGPTAGCRDRGVGTGAASLSLKLAF